MKIFKTIATVFVLSGTLMMSSCRVQETIDPNLDIKGLGGIEYARTELDDWLDETFLDKYNIQIVYRWNASDVYNNVTKKLVPPRVTKVRPMMNTISKIWFEPYIYAANYGFLQELAPKTLVLAGSKEYANARGTAYVLGTAESGVKIFLTNVNDFDPTNRTGLIEYMHVIEHEFVHVLDQKINVPPSFKAISNQYYDPTGWQDTNKYPLDNTEAYRLGFFSNYAMSSPGEDIAEVVSLLLVNGWDWFENTVIPIARSSEVNALAETHLRAKVSEMEKYLQENFGIALFDNASSGKKGLITAVQEAIDYVIENYEQFLEEEE